MFLIFFPVHTINKSFGPSGSLADYYEERGTSIRVRTPRESMDVTTQGLVSELIQVLDKQNIEEFCQKKLRESSNVRR